jgi:hypothetical protein
MLKSLALYLTGRVTPFTWSRYQRRETAQLNEEISCVSRRCATVLWVNGYECMPRTEGRPNDQKRHSCKEDEVLLVKVLCKVLVLGVP